MTKLTKENHPEICPEDNKPCDNIVFGCGDCSKPGIKDESGNTVWCEQCGEMPATCFGGYANECDECHKNTLEATTQDVLKGVF